MIVYVTVFDIELHNDRYCGFHYYTSIEELKECEGDVEYVSMTMAEYNRLNGFDFDDSIGLN